MRTRWNSRDRSLTRFVQTMVICGMAGALLLGNATAEAQGVRAKRTAHTRERTREYIDDYSNSVGMPDEFETPRPASDRDPAASKIDVKALRNLIHNFADSMTQLTFDLNDQTSQIPGLRPIYSDAMRLSGTALSLHKRADKAGVDGAMIDDLQQLDADWRELAFNLQRVAHLSKDSQGLVQDLRDIAEKMRELTHIQPQLDRRQLNLKAAALAADLDNLQDDVLSELGNSPDTQFYRRSLSRARQVILNLVTMVRDDRSDSDVIVEEYRQFETLWTPLATKLRNEDDRFIERGLRRVAVSSQEIQQLLLLPETNDPTRFLDLAKSLRSDVKEFMERTPLALALRLQNAKQALTASEQFDTASSHFVEVVGHRSQPAEVADAFRRVEQTGVVFVQVYGDIDSDRALALLNRIKQTLRSLRSALHLQEDDFDDRRAASLAAAILNSTEQLQTAVARWLENDPQSFGDQCQEDISDMLGRVAKLHGDIVTGHANADLRAEITSLYDTWRRVYPCLVKCHTEDRTGLGRLASTLTPALVDLRTMILE